MYDLHILFWKMSEEMDNKRSGYYCGKHIGYRLRKLNAGNADGL